MNRIKTAEEQIEAGNQDFYDTVQKILSDANYNRVSQQDIDKAFNNSAPSGFSMKIDFE